MQAGFPEVKKLFLKKVHQYIKDRSLDPKYACAFLLGLGSLQSVQEKKSEVALAGLFVNFILFVVFINISR